MNGSQRSRRAYPPASTNRLNWPTVTSVRPIQNSYSTRILRGCSPSYDSRLAIAARPLARAAAVRDATDVRGLAEFYRKLLGLQYRPGDEPPADGAADDHFADPAGRPLHLEDPEALDLLRDDAVPRAARAVGVLDGRDVSPREEEGDHDEEAHDVGAGNDLCSAGRSVP